MTSFPKLYNSRRNSLHNTQCSKWMLPRSRGERFFYIPWFQTNSDLVNVLFVLVESCLKTTYLILLDIGFQRLAAASHPDDLPGILDISTWIVALMFLVLFIFIIWKRQIPFVQIPNTRFLWKKLGVGFLETISQINHSGWCTWFFFVNSK